MEKDSTQHQFDVFPAYSDVLLMAAIRRHPLERLRQLGHGLADLLIAGSRSCRFDATEKLLVMAYLLCCNCDAMLPLVQGVYESPILLRGQILRQLRGLGSFNFVDYLISCHLGLYGDFN